MRKLLVVCVVSGLAAGCYGHAHVHGSVGYRGPNPIAAVATAVAVAAVVHAVATAPPVAVQVEYYDYGHNPGHVWVNGRYTYVNNGWVWNRGYWQVEQPGYYSGSTATGPRRAPATSTPISRHRLRLDAGRLGSRASRSRVRRRLVDGLQRSPHVESRRLATR